MQENTETKSRPSESASSDSGIVPDHQMLSKDGCADGRVNISTCVEYHTDNKPCETDQHTPETVKVENDVSQCNFTTPSKPPNPSSSPESTHISIESINEDDVDSSVIDSDSDFEDMPTNGEFIIEKLGQHMTSNDSKNGIIVISQNQVEKPNAAEVAQPRPQIGSIAVQNSTDITFGDKTFYQGPVTIKQFLLDNNKWRPTDSNGNINSAFDGSDGEKKNDVPKEKDSLTTKSKKIFFKTKAVTLTAGLLFILFIIITIVLCSVLLTQSKSLNFKLGDGDDSRTNIPINSTIGDDNIGGGTVLRIISRAEWVAQPPRHKLNDLELPAKRVIIAHTATEFCDTQASCTFHVRYIQTFHMESRNWDDISYNFLIGGDGAIYEGRGWNKEGAHTKGFNKNSICIAFIGTFIDAPPNDRQLNAAKLLIEEGLREHKLASDYKLFGHRQLIPSESPGSALFEIIKTWPHWSNDI